MSSNIIAKIAACTLVSLSLAACAAEPTVRYAPPPDCEEAVGPAPNAEQFWVRGHWQWEGQQYAWLSGHWEARRSNAVYSPGHWRSNAAGAWVWTEGRWVVR